jgi:hypothetical protein
MPRQKVCSSSAIGVTKGCMCADVYDFESRKTSTTQRQKEKTSGQEENKSFIKTEPYPPTLQNILKTKFNCNFG